MNDYARGALETLAWVGSLMGPVGSEQAAATLARLHNEVEGAQTELLHGSAVDFRARLRASWAFK